MHRDGPRNNRHVLTLLHDDITVGPVHLYTRSQMTSTNFKFFSGLGFPTDIVYLTQQTQSKTMQLKRKQLSRRPAQLVS
ncbi:hypothetical protein M404DRAFT_998502 [Pisolithus tinctorius Marx 270]|uniref:Uncharacterized protein n=1 Tax=Pisolithus tinctorius Marx 270 TaxID=870435 RepID=A0A0C3P1Z0_PISTI|nr:hypothetical protein M404DRAFT_998502 [Pisolithus tinctorius Marx 270]